MMETATTADMMELFGLSDRSVRDHAKSGIFVRTGHGQYDLKASIRAYVTHMREAAAGRPATNEDLRAEKIRLTAAQADMAEMAKNAQAERMVDVEEFEKRWTDEMASLKANLLSLPGKIAATCPQFSQHDILAIDDVLRRLMERIADEADQTAQSFEQAAPAKTNVRKQRRKGRR